MVTSNNLNPIDFCHRQIALTFKIFRRDGGQETIHMDGQSRILASISDTGISAGRQASLEIEGMPLDLMNRLSFGGGYIADDGSKITGISHSSVSVHAGVRGKTLATIFDGQICEAFIDFSSSPDVSFRVKAQDTNQLSQIVKEQLNYREAVPAATVLHDLCKRHGLEFVDHGGWGDKDRLKINYLNGDLLTQIKRIVHSVKGEVRLDAAGGIYHDGKASTGVPTLHAWGRFAARGEKIKANTIPVVSPETGMIGYPSYSPVECRIKTIFRPELTFYSMIKLESRYLPAAFSSPNAQKLNQPNDLVKKDDHAQKAPWNGHWFVVAVNHDLSSEKTGGAWFTQIKCTASTYAQRFAEKSK